MNNSVTQPINNLLAPALALCSWVSINPYFFWDYGRHMALAGMAAGLLALLAIAFGDRPRKSELLGFGLIASFIIYISLLPKTDGTLTRWYFVLPTMLAIFIFCDSRRASVIKAFSLIFAASILPGIGVSILSILGVQFDFEHKPLLNEIMAANFAYYMHIPGVLLLGNNAIPLPWGGVLYRLCGVYDEPGMVGTLAAFLLAAGRFRIRSPLQLVIFIGGILSFSLAFMVLAVAGLSARLMLTRSLKPLAPISCCVLATLLITGVANPKSIADFVTSHISNEPTHELSPSINKPIPLTYTEVGYSQEETPAPAPVQPSSTDWAEDVTRQAHTSIVEAAEEIAEPAPSDVAAPVEANQGLRQTQYLNNRSLPEMQKLINDYWSSDFKTLLFGISSDASIVYGGVSQVVSRIFTDFGIIGMALFVAALASIAWSMSKRSESPLWVLLFFALFALSIYQRPIVWMPYAFTIFACCPAYISGMKRSAEVPLYWPLRARVA